MFKAYDVRGVYGSEVTDSDFYYIGKAFAAIAKDSEAVVGMDYRAANPLLLNAFANGFGGKIRFAGNSPTPAIVYSTRDYGACLTASHCASDFVGLKPFVKQRVFYSSELSELKQEFNNAMQDGKPVLKKIVLPTDESVLEEYVQSIPQVSRGWFDLCGGAACAVRSIFPKTIFHEPDSAFSRHSAEPKDDTLSALKQKTLDEKTLGFAFDGDADRVVAVDSGRVIDGAVLGAFSCIKHLKKNDSVVLTIDCPDEIHSFLQDSGFNVHYSAVGDVNVLKKVEETNSAFSFERSGHYAFTKHMIYSDGIYSAAVLSNTRPGDLIEFSKQFTNVSLITAVPGKADFVLLAKLIQEKTPVGLETLDGVKARFDDYCVLIRASQTEPKIRVNVEAKTNALAKKGMDLALELLKKALNSSPTA